MPVLVGLLSLAYSIDISTRLGEVRAPADGALSKSPLNRALEASAHTARTHRTRTDPILRRCAPLAPPDSYNTILQSKSSGTAQPPMWWWAEACTHNVRGRSDRARGRHSARGAPRRTGRRVQTPRFATTSCAVSLLTCTRRSRACSEIGILQPMHRSSFHH